MLLPSPSHKCFSSSSTVSPWPGLRSWRDTLLNHNRKWGPHGPEPELQSKLHDSPFGQASSLAELGSIVLSTPDPLAKSHLSHLAFSLYRSHNLPIGLSQPPSSPARPQNPQLVCSLFRPPHVCFNSSINPIMKILYFSVSFVISPFVLYLVSMLLHGFCFVLMILCLTIKSSCFL